MEKHIISIKSITHLTHDVLQIRTSKPNGYEFKPGQATEVSINNSKWITEQRPFTFTSLPSDDYLEFTIKTYTAHKGVTNELLSLKELDELVIHDVWGIITYHQPGVFIAGGAGITPFISILRELDSRHAIGSNMLLYANKTQRDIIQESEFEYLLGKSFINVLSDEKRDGYHHGMITEDFIKEHVYDFNQPFYVCGPPPMLKEIEKQLHNLGVADHHIIKESF
jgi:ferredoxin-NADP reductase